jgi:hypothetical protein
VVAVNRQQKPTLVFLDPNTGEDLSRPTDKDDKDVEFISGLGYNEDRIYGLDEWEYKKDDRAWKFFLLSTRQGRLLVVSAKRPALLDATNTTEESASPKVRYWTRWKESKSDEPIFSVLGLAKGILYCVGDTLHFDVLDVEQKKLKPMKSFVLNSPATSLRELNGKIAVLTSRDGLHIVDHTIDDDSSEMRLVHVDFGRRDLVHLIEAGITEPEGSGRADASTSTSTLVLVGDRECRVAGLSVPWKTPGRDCEAVFEAELPASIRKFRRGRTLPTWLGRRRAVPQYGAMPDARDSGEILGMCLDGSLHHFTLLSREAWELLRFVQNIAAASPEMSPLGRTQHDADNRPAAEVQQPRVDNSFGMHIDGDLLQRCLDARALERLISRPDHLARLAELLDEIDDGRWTADFEGGVGERREQCFQLVYDILEYYLAPVL